jgi:hypothetical protein
MPISFGATPRPRTSNCSAAGARTASPATEAAQGRVAAFGDGSDMTPAPDGLAAYPRALGPGHV